MKEIKDFIREFGSEESSLLKETEYLCSNPEIMESILEGANEDLSECVEMEDGMF